MSKTYLASAVFVISFLFMATLVPAAAYLKIGDIKGEATDNEHKEWIIIQSFSHGIERESNPIVGSTRRKSNADFTGLTLTKELDKSTPLLMEASTTGKVIPEAEFELVSPSSSEESDGRQAYYKYKLENVIVSSYSISGDADDRPTEEVTLNFEKIEVIYKPQKRDGAFGSSVRFVWDLVKNLGGSR